MAAAQDDLTPDPGSIQAPGGDSGGELAPDPGSVVAPASAGPDVDLTPDPGSVQMPAAASPAAPSGTPSEASPGQYKPKTPGRFLTDEDLGQAMVNPDGRQLKVTPDFLRRAAGWFGGRAFQEAHLFPGFVVGPEELQALGERLLLGGDVSDKTAEAAPSAERTNGVLAGLGESAKYNLGRALGMVGMDMPQNLVRKAATALGGLTEDESDALVNLQEIIHNRRPWSEAGMDLLGNVLTGGEAFAAIGAGAGRAATVAAHAGVAGATGAGLGYAKSRVGEELHDTVRDALVGTVLGTAGSAVGGVARIVGGVRTRAVQYVADRLAGDADAAAAEAGGAGVEARIAEMRTMDEASEPAIRRLVGDPEALADRESFVAATSSEERQRIAETAARVAGETSDQATAKFLAAEEAGVSQADLFTDEAHAYVADKAAALGKALGGEAAARQGDEHAGKVLDGLLDADRVRRAALDVVEEHGAASTGTLFRLGAFFPDNRAVLSAADRRFGTKLVETGDLLSARANAAMTQSGAVYEQLEKKIMPALRNVEKTLVDGTEYTPQALGDALNTGEWGNLQPRQRAAAQAFKDVQEFAAGKAESFANDFEDLGISGIRVPRLRRGTEGSYLHNTVLDPVNFVLNLSEHLEDAGGARGLLRRAEAAGTDSVENAVLRGLRLWAGGNLGTEEEVVAAARSLRDINLDGEALQTRAGALLRREEAIPDFLLEKDPVKALMRWTNSTFRHLASRDGLAELSSAAGALEEVSPNISDYIQNLVKDLSGQRRGTIAGGIRGWWLRQQLSLEREARVADDAGQDFRASILRGTAGLDRVYSRMTSNMYSYYLGLNPLTIGKHLAQPVINTLPALGASDPVMAGAMMTRAYGAALRDFILGRAGATLRGEGLQASGIPMDAARWYEDGVRAATGGRGGAMLEAFSRKMMFGLETAITINRNVTRNLARDMVGVLAAGPEALQTRAGKVAAEALASAEPAYRDSVLSLIRSGQVEEAKQAFTRYLNGSTQFNYTRAARSEYGRTVGQAFSMFSKWPSVAAGDIFTLADAVFAGRASGGVASLEAERRVVQGLQKYLAPIAFASGAGMMGWEEYAKEHPQFKEFFGSDPLAWTAVDSARALGRFVGLGSTQGSPMTPPVVEDFWTGAKHGDLRGIVDGLGEAAISGLPAGVFLRFLTRDAPATLFDESLPGGSTAERLHSALFGERQ